MISSCVWCAIDKYKLVIASYGLYTSLLFYLHNLTVSRNKFLFFMSRDFFFINFLNLLISFNQLFHTYEELFLVLHQCMNSLCMISIISLLVANTRSFCCYSIATCAYIVKKLSEICSQDPVQNPVRHVFLRYDISLNLLIKVLQVNFSVLTFWQL